jgi:hypothetical protein
MPAPSLVSSPVVETVVQPNFGARFTLDGGNELESRLNSICQRVLMELPSIVPAARLEGILLGGGYGRGEGGVLQTEAGELPYNDLEFYVFVRGHPRLNERRHGEALHELARRLSYDAGLDVEFKILSFARLRHSRPEMFYYDLVMGHRWLLGDESLLVGCDQHRNASLIPMYEATRLMMNRCSGLLFAREQLLAGRLKAEQVDFVGRNLAKAQLALGDVLLTAYGQYHWSCRERQLRLQKFVGNRDIPWVDEVRLHHGEGVSFKLHPRRERGSPEELAALFNDLAPLALRVWLWLENRRLNHHFLSASDYSLSPVNLCPETREWKNRLLNARHFGWEKLLLPRRSPYPRERVLRAFPLLLWEPGLLQDFRLLHCVQDQLDTLATNTDSLHTAYRSVWSNFN